jgi:ferrochelatase
VILSTFESEAGFERYVADVAAARAACEAAGQPVPGVQIAPAWSERSGFVEASASLLALTLERIPAERRFAAEVVFTAHSIPLAMAGRSTYEAQFRRAGAAIAERAGQPRHRFAYQSRTGRPTDPWLEPDVNLVLEELARAGVRDCVVAPIGFVCDHVEVLYDLDVEARATAERCGLALVRSPTVNDHAAFIAMLADVVCDAWSASA